METLVLKFGGASVSNPEKFLQIADIIIERSKEYPQIVVVVSAMGDTTDHLLELSQKIHPNPPKREQDMLVSAGERISASLLAMALYNKGKEAISFTGSQAGVITCARHSEARIVEVRPHRLIPHLKNQRVVIVAGFQGMGLNGEITTLGRGGSDTSAVALAVSLEAAKVEFYKDVEGIYSQDPKVSKNAKKISLMSYDSALEKVKGGDGVLHARAIELAKQNQIILQVLSYKKFSSNEKLPARGTFIGTSSKEKKSQFEINFEESRLMESICI